MADKTATIPRETVKTLAKLKGIRPAARELGISEEVVLKWSQRDPDGPWTITSKTDCPQSVLTPSQAIHDSLSADSKATRAGFSKASRKVAEHLAEQKPERILKNARQMKDVASTAQMVHGWNEGKAGSGTLNLNILGGQSAVQIIQGNGPSTPEDAL